MKRALPLLALLATLLAAANAQTRTVKFNAFMDISLLPGAQWLLPAKQSLVNNINIQMTPAVIAGPVGATAGNELIRFNSMIYSSSRGSYPFAPTMRLKAGQTAYIGITNSLPLEDPTAHGAKFGQYDANGLPYFGRFAHPSHTSFHVHGSHDSPGHFGQAATEAVTYVGGDNIFRDINPGGGMLNWRTELPEDHMSGLAWYHPHKHGSTTLQTATSNGLMIIEDNATRWFPDQPAIGSNCLQMRTFQKNAPEKVFHIGMHTFATYNPSNDPVISIEFQNIAEEDRWMDDTNIQVASNWSDPRSPLCCNTGKNEVNGTLKDKDFVLINGGWQPRWTMPAGKWQRTRWAHTGFKRFMELTITKKNPAYTAINGLPQFIHAPECEIKLFAKDGLYLPKVPRLVPMIFLSAGNRAEAFMRCNKPGDYFVAAGHDPSPFVIDPTDTSMDDPTTGDMFSKFHGLMRFQQPIVMSLRVTVNSYVDPPLVEEACTTVFPNYAADLSDANLIKSGLNPYPAGDPRITPGIAALKPINHEFVSFTLIGQDYGCLVNNKQFEYPDAEPINMTLGQVTHWDFAGNIEHPAHMHINPSYIVDLPTSSLAYNWQYTSWWRPGDRFDTLQIPVLADQVQVIPVRTQAGPYAGISVMHCHFLNHEDQGCMKIVKWTCPGFEGWDTTQPKVCLKTPGQKIDGTTGKAQSPTAAAQKRVGLGWNYSVTGTMDYTGICKDINLHPC